MPQGQIWTPPQRWTLGLAENAPSPNPATTKRLTLGLVNNPDSGKLTTSQRLTLGLEKNGLGAKISTQRLPRGPPAAKWLKDKMQHPATDLGTVRKWPEGKSVHLPASPSALPFIAYQHCPSKQGKERELSIGNL